MPKVSVLIPTYNQSALLHEALTSVRNQTETNWEAIIVNNHSDDDTLEIIKTFEEPRFRPVNVRNNGIIAISRNLGLQIAQSDWIAFLDSDDLWHREKLQICLDEAGTRDIISHREATIQNGLTIRISPRYHEKRATYRNLLFKGNCLSPSALMVRRDLLEEVGGFSECAKFVTCEDYDLWLRLSALNPRFQFIDSVLSSYRLHEGNTSGSICQHMNAGLEVSDSHYRALRPKVKFDGVRFRRQCARIIYSAGRSYQKSGNFAKARTCFWRSFLVFPLLGRTLAFGGAAWIGLNPSFEKKSLLLRPFARDETKFVGYIDQVRKGSLVSSVIIFLGYVWALSIFILYIIQFEDILVSLAGRLAR